MPAKLTSQEIDNRLIGREIQRLDDYINASTKIQFQCLKDNCRYIWKTKPTSILHSNAGCPKCKNVARMTNNDVDINLLHRNIKRIGNIINNRIPIEFLCLKENCGYRWFAAPAAVIIAPKSGCPACGKTLILNNEIIDNRLKNKNIQRLENYINTRTPIKFQCLSCNDIFERAPYSIINHNQGCALCNNMMINEKIVYYALQKNNINFVSQFSIRKINTNELKKYRVDFYLPQNNIIIEYNGPQHYKIICFGGMSIKDAEENLIKQQNRDRYIEEFCIENNIKLIWIDGREYNGKKLTTYINNLIESI